MRETSISRNTEFQSFVASPYVRSSVRATMEWAIRNSALVQKVFNVFQRLPDFADSVLDSGADKLKELSRYAPWVDDYEHCLVYGFPGESITDVIQLPNGEYMKTIKVLSEVG